MRPPTVARRTRFSHHQPPHPALPRLTAPPATPHRLDELRKSAGNITEHWNLRSHELNQRLHLFEQSLLAEDTYQWVRAARRKRVAKGPQARMLQTRQTLAWDAIRSGRPDALTRRTQGLAPSNPLCRGWSVVMSLLRVYIAISVPLGLSFWRDEWRPANTTYQVRPQKLPPPPLNRRMKRSNSSKGYRSHYGWPLDNKSELRANFHSH